MYLFLIYCTRNPKMKITYLEEYHYVIMFKRFSRKVKKKEKKTFPRWTQDLQFIFSTNTRATEFKSK